MDPEPHSNNESTSPSATDEMELISRGGGMFAGSQNFVVAGGTFTNLTTNYVAAPAVPRGLHMIPLGDIDLQQDLSVETRSGFIGLRQERRCARRVYSAKIAGQKSNITVAMYQGDRAEEEWREDVERYLAVRHPNIVQVREGASHGNIHAAVFHGDLVPFKQYMARCSPIMTVYRCACWAYEWDRAAKYLYEMLQHEPLSDDHQTWIRCSTAQLCLDLIAPSPEEPRIDIADKEAMFDPKITTKGNLGDAFRIFTEKLKSGPTPPDTRIEPEADEDRIIVYTDGSATNNGKANARAGAGAYYGPDDVRNLAIRVPEEQLPSNQTAEILAIKETIESNPKDVPLKILSDSKYVIEGLTKNLHKWEDEGF
ncbi:hypothetical protein C8R46DRAFT_1357467 [Mycena filopes]|nr:hypothetical protein C8R46DRAFT_1357467 [Mycena filopes]